MENTLLGTKTIENRGGHSCTVQAVDISWPSFNAALYGRAQVPLHLAFHQHLLPLEVRFPPFLACSLPFMHSFWVFLSVSLIWLWLKALSVVLSEVCPRLARSQSFSDLFRHIQFTLAQCAVKAMILIQEKKRKISLFFSPPSNFNVYISF